MANFNGRRAPNVSQYLANLNTVPSAQELSAQNEFDLGSDGLDFLTNAEFFDFDASTFDPTPNVDFAQQPQAGQHGAKSAGMPINGPGFQFSEFQTYPQPMNNLSSTQGPNLQGTYPPQQQQQQQQQPLQQQQHQSQHFAQAIPGEKRKASTAALQPLPELEDSSRYAAEEDKRRRNTAASARFRVKKKQREQALEKQAKEMADKVTALEGKVNQLEMENKWLKGLITEKSDVRGMEEQFKKFADERKIREAEERSREGRSDGVGTEEFEGEGEELLV